MRIGINLLYLIPGQVGGTEIYAKGLLHGLSCIDSEHEFVVFLNQSAANWPLPQTSNFYRVICPIWGASQSQRYLYEQLRFPFILRKEGVDLVHSLGYVGPLFTGIPSVVTVHDMNFISLRSIMPVHKIIARAFFVILTVHRTKHIITDSVFSKKEIVRYLAISTKKITVIPASIFERPQSSFTWEKIRDRYSLKPPYIVAFSSRSKHKNINGLLSAYSLLKDQFPHNLVLIGHIPSRINLPKLKRTLRLDGRVITTGFLPDEDIQPVLGHASLFVFPSFYEGFGFPLLEAQAAGVPIVSSKAGSLPEIGGDSALYFDPASITEMACVISRCLSDSELTDRLIRSGLKNIQRFSWKNTALKTLEVYQKILS